MYDVIDLIVENGIRIGLDWIVIFIEKWACIYGILLSICTIIYKLRIKSIVSHVYLYVDVHASVCRLYELFSMGALILKWAISIVKFKKKIAIRKIHAIKKKSIVLNDIVNCCMKNKQRQQEQKNVYSNIYKIQYDSYWPLSFSRLNKIALYQLILCHISH